MTSRDYTPPIATNDQMRDYYEWHVQAGRGRLPALLDRRGLEHLKPTKHETVGLGLPPPEEMFSNTATYARAVF